MLFKTTLIINSKLGQLGNRLLKSSHVMACAIENGLKVINIPFDDYAEFFTHTRHNPLCSYPAFSILPLPPVLMKKFMVRGRIDFISRKLLQAFTKYVPFGRYHEKQSAHIQIKWGQEFSLNTPDFLNLLKEKRFIAFTGWGMRDYRNVEKHGDKIRAYFAPLAKHRRAVSRLICEARKTCSVLIGVHIRQGDTRNPRSFAGTMGWFYETEEYFKVMKSVEKLFAGERVGFLICSDDRQDKNKFSGFNVTFGNYHIAEDMYSLARCDYIMGAPSTYSLWASFYGKKPLYHIYDTRRAPALSDFEINNNLRWNYL